MACVYLEAEKGYIWAPTDLGKTIGRIAAKFTDPGNRNQRYIFKVPQKWVEAGYVKQVRA